MIWTVFRKELMDTLRDRRTLMTMIIIPTLIFPLILTVMSKVSGSFAKDQASKKLRVGLVSNDVGSFTTELMTLPASLGKKTTSTYSDSNALKKAIDDKKIDIGFFVPEGTQAKKETKQTAQIFVFHNGTDIGMKERAQVYTDVISQKWTSTRLKELNVSASQLTPLNVEFRNVASDKEMFGKLVGGFLPYIFIAFGFMGCLYPAIDLFTGEKERGTIETLLTTPVARWKILIGKMGVVVLSGFTAACFSFFGLYASVEFFNLVKDKEFLDLVHELLTPSFIFLMLFLLFPLIIFFAGIMIPISVRAKSFKEAQSTLTPINFIIILPAMVGFLPGVELNMGTALIPIVNIVLASKELIAGTLEWHLVGVSFAVMVLFAAAAVLFSYKKFEDERNILN